MYPLIFTDSIKTIESDGDISDTMTNYEVNAMSVEHPKDKTLLLDFLDEMRFDVKHSGNKSSRDKSLVKIINSPAIRAGLLRELKPKTCSMRFLSSDPDELYNRLKLLIQDKEAGNNSDIIIEEIVVIAEKLLEYKYISTKQHRFLIKKCLF